jgi:hypothetical protein
MLHFYEQSSCSIFFSALGAFAEPENLAYFSFYAVAVEYIFFLTCNYLSVILILK